MPKITKKVAELLKREAELVKSQNRFNDADFNAEWDRRIQAGRSAAATEEDIQRMAALLDGSWKKSYWGQREAITFALDGFRNESFITFRDEFLIPALEEREDRREKLDQDVEELKAKYPGLKIVFDEKYDSASIEGLAQIAYSDRPPGNLDFAILVETNTLP
jgi:hypothetical protein